MQSYVPAALDRAGFNGYADVLTSHSGDKAGVYSDPQIWAGISGAGADSLIPSTCEWTHPGYTGSLSP